MPAAPGTDSLIRELLGFLSIILVPLGAFLLVRGLRGRVVGDDPHCRKCSFNLRGRDPSSTKCPECGTDLTPAAIRVGLRQRRPAMLSIGLGLLLISGSILGFAGYRAAMAYDWSPWKPVSWLLADLDAAAPADRARAAAELARRAGDASTAQPKLDALIDGLLDRQADPTRRWELSYGKIIESAALANRVDRPRLERYLKQGLIAGLELKPKLRRGQSMTISLNLDLNRFGPDRTLRGTWRTEPVTIDGNVLVRTGWASSSDQPEELSHSIGYTSGTDDRTWKDSKIADGKHVAKSAVVATVEMTKPVAIGPLTVAVPVSTPVEIVPADATVDTFEADPAKRDEMLKSLSAARVLTKTESGQLDVRIKAGSLPVSVAAEVVLSQGGVEQKVGMLRIDAGKPSRWVPVRAWRKPEFTAGAVDVHLRPAQAAADGTQKLDVYWGEKIVIKDVVIDAPYVPPFRSDPSLRAAVEKALARPKIERRPSPGARKTEALALNLRVDKSPVKLAYQVFLATNGREIKAADWSTPAGQNSGHAFLSQDVDPAGVATSCDVILRPDPDWESRTYDTNPPWDGEIVFHDVPITPAAATPGAR